MSVYIHLRDELLSSEEELTVRQYWIEADCVEVQWDCIAYLDTKSGEWKTILEKDYKFYLSPIPTHPHNLGYDFLWIRDRLMEGCKLG
jgi:hypothetical protein